MGYGMISGTGLWCSSLILLVADFSLRRAVLTTIQAFETASPPGG